MSTWDDANSAGDAAASAYIDNAVASAVNAAVAPVQSQLDSANATIQNLQATNSSLSSQLSALQAQETADKATIQQLQNEIQQLQNPTPTPVAKQEFSAYAGPRTADQYLSTDYANTCKTFGVSVLPVDRIYSETSYGKAQNSPSPAVAVSYKQVAGLGGSAGPSSSVVTAITNEMKTLAGIKTKTFYVSLDHEVDNKVKNGTYDAATYKRAAQQFYNIVKSVGASNIKVTVCFMAWSFTQATTNTWYPANLYVDGAYDVIAIDGYYGPSTTGSAVFDKAVIWANTKKLPLAIWEVGWFADGSSTQSYSTESAYTQRVQATVDYMGLHPEIIQVLWFDANKSSSNNLMDTHPNSVAIWAKATQAS